MIDRDAAQEAAREELGRAEYHRDDPDLVERGFRAVQDWLADLFDRVGSNAPGGWLPVLALVALIVIAVAVVLYRIGGVRGDAETRSVLPTGRRRTAAEYRADAATAAEQGRFDVAVRDRLRAVAAELEERQVLDARPGRTADELARDAAAALAERGSGPDTAFALRAASTVFDDVHYGGRPATADGYATVVAADDLVRAARRTAGVP